MVSQPGNIDTLLALNEALDRLAEQAPRQAQIAELKLFAGLEDAEIATAVGVSKATVKRDWSETKKLIAVAISTS